jgi:hypothetical protein
MMIPETMVVVSNKLVVVRRQFGVPHHVPVLVREILAHKWTPAVYLEK